jgi:hypothetical protein
MSQNRVGGNESCQKCQFMLTHGCRLPDTCRKVTYQAPWGCLFFVLDSAGAEIAKPRGWGLAMNTDTNRPDDPDPDDLDGLAASLDHLRRWCEPEGTSDSSAG